jgi:hypothetical protein
MSSNPPPSTWTTPEYVAAVVAILATGGLVFYSALTASGLTVNEVVFVVLTITVPATLAYELARRVGPSSR